jgi:hypothetical protein
VGTTERRNYDDQTIEYAENFHEQSKFEIEILKLVLKFVENQEYIKSINRDGIRGSQEPSSI